MYCLSIQKMRVFANFGHMRISTCPVLLVWECIRRSWFSSFILRRHLNFDYLCFPWHWGERFHQHRGVICLQPSKYPFGICTTILNLDPTTFFFHLLVRPQGPPANAHLSPTESRNFASNLWYYMPRVMEPHIMLTNHVLTSCTA